MELFGATMEALKTGGPWFLVAVCLFVVRYIYLESKVAREAHAKEKQELNDRLLGIVKEQTTLSTLVLENLKQTNRALNNLEVSE